MTVKSIGALVAAVAITLFLAACGGGTPPAAPEASSAPDSSSMAEAMSSSQAPSSAPVSSAETSSSSELATPVQTTPLAPETGKQYDVALLMAPDGIADKILGNADAKVTFIEYASPTCPHCALFSNEVLPGFITKYVDTGKVKFVLRPFARNNIDAAIFLLAEAAAKATDAPAVAPATDSSAVSSTEVAPTPAPVFSQAAVEAYHNVISTYFRTQSVWAADADTYAALLKVATQLGFSKETFDAALKDEAAFAPIQSMRDQALKSFGLEGTPTFYVNGKQLTGEKSIDQLSAEVDALL